MRINTKSMKKKYHIATTGTETLRGLVAPDADNATWDAFVQARKVALEGHETSDRAWVDEVRTAFAQSNATHQ